jgi:hypothetical protein
MSQIVIDIPGAYLSNAAVAAALAKLTLALGGHSSAPAPASVQADARIAANDKPAAVSPGEEKFNSWVNTLETRIGVKAVCTGLLKAGAAGLTIEKVRELFPSSTTNRQVAGTLTALIFRCPQKCGFSPVVKDGDSYRWVGFPQA